MHHPSGMMTAWLHASEGDMSMEIKRIMPLSDTDAARAQTMESIETLWGATYESADEDGNTYIVQDIQYPFPDTPFEMWGLAVRRDEPAWIIEADGKVFRNSKNLYLAIYHMDSECESFLKAHQDFLEGYSVRFSGDGEYDYSSIADSVPAKFGDGLEFDLSSPDEYVRMDGSMVSFDILYDGATYFDNGNIHHIYNAENQPDDSVNAETEE